MFIRYEVADRLPDGVLEPEVRLRDDRVRASGRLVLASFSGLADIVERLGGCDGDDAVWCVPFTMHMDSDHADLDGYHA